MLKACVCCLWCLEKCLAYLNQVSVFGSVMWSVMWNRTSRSEAKRSPVAALFRTLTPPPQSTAPASAPRPATLSSSWWRTPCEWRPSTQWETLSSSWERYQVDTEQQNLPTRLDRNSLLTLSSQVLIVSCTAFCGVLALNYQRHYTVWVLPLLIVCAFAFLVAHCFLSVFENVVDVLFLCFAIDTKYNDGSPGREYYMDKALMVRLGWCSSSCPLVDRGLHSSCCFFMWWSWLLTQVQKSWYKNN